jgi:hypothetical protein
MDGDWEHLGGTYSDDWDDDGTADSSGSNFTVLNEDGSRVESGTSTWINWEGVSETRTFEFTYDKDWNLLKGTETSSNGETVEFGKDWEVLSVSRTVDLDSGAFVELSEADLAGIPSALAAASGKTYVETVANPWGTQKTYLDSDGQILGYSDAYSDDWNDDGKIDSQGTSFQDADWNHLGSTFEDNWSKGFFHTVEGTQDVDGDGVLDNVYIETSSRTDKKDVDADGVYTGTVTTSKFVFDENWNMVKGTETRGTTTTVFKENWEVDSVSVDVSDLIGVSVSGLPASVQTLLFSGESDLENVKASVEQFSWGEGSQTTYFDEDGNILGYMDTHKDDWGSGTSYMDANWNHIGGTYSDEWGSGSNFTVLNEDGTSVETGTSTWKNDYGDDETRTFEFKYDANGELLEGKETTSGTTITWGPGWEQLASKVSVTELVALTPAELALLPAPLKAAEGSPTYSKEQVWGEGSKQTTYLDGDGNILGYHDTWSEGVGGHGGSSFMDANWNHLGGSWADGMGNSGESIRVKNIGETDPDKAETETGKNTFLDENDVPQTNSYVFHFNANGDMTGGTETRPDGSKVNLGPDWTFLGEEISVDGLDSISQADFNLLPGSITGATAAATLVKDMPSTETYQGGPGGQQGGFTQKNFTEQ